MQNSCAKKKKRKIKIFVFLALFFIEAGYLYYSSNKILMNTGSAMYEGVLSSASYYAISEALKESESFDKLIDIQYNSDGNVSSIILSSYKFNSITSLIADKVCLYLDADLKNGVPVHVGAFTGINMFAGFGKTFNMPLITVNSVKCEIISEFTSAGINQTRHALYVAVIPDVYIVTRTNTQKLEDSIKLLVYDNVICGSIPEFYMTGGIYSAERKM